MHVLLSVWAILWNYVWEYAISKFFAIVYMYMPSYYIYVVHVQIIKYTNIYELMYLNTTPTSNINVHMYVYMYMKVCVYVIFINAYFHENNRNIFA